MSDQKIADPGPLGLAGFAMTTFCLSAANANLWKGASVSAALALALIYGGSAQILAGMWEFVRKNTFGALAFTSYGAFWIGLYILLKVPAVASGDTTNTVAIYLLAWTIFTLYMTVAALKTNAALLSVFVALDLTFIFLTIGAWGAGHSTMTKVGGWLGLLTAALAWYCSAAGVINETHGKTMLPLGPLG